MASGIKPFTATFVDRRGRRNALKDGDGKGAFATQGDRGRETRGAGSSDRNGIPTYHCSKSSSEQNPGPMAASSPYVPGAGFRRSRNSSSTNNTDDDDRFSPRAAGNPMMPGARHREVRVRFRWPSESPGLRYASPTHRYRRDPDRDLRETHRYRPPDAGTPYWAHLSTERF